MSSLTARRGVASETFGAARAGLLARCVEGEKRMAVSVASLIKQLRPFRARSEAYARDALLALGGRYREAVEEKEEAPRRREVKLGLDAITAAAQTLAKTIRGSGLPVLERLTGNRLPVAAVEPSDDSHGLPWARDPRDALREAAGVAYGRGPIEADAEQSNRSNRRREEWVYRLPTAAAIAPVLSRLDALAELAGTIDAEIAADRGGRGDLYSEQWGNPKAELAREAFMLFASCRPADAERVGGPLLDFAASVLHWASDGKEDGGSIQPYLRRVVAWARGYGAHRACIAELRRKLPTCGGAEREAVERELADELTLAVFAPPRSLIALSDPPADEWEHAAAVHNATRSELERVTGLVRRGINQPDDHGG